MTTISDLIVPEIFTPYMMQETVKHNAFLNSGIASRDDSVVITKGGKTVNIPFFEQMNASSEVLAEGTALTVNKITAAKDVAAVHARGMAYAASDLSKLFSGADPIAAIAMQSGQQWSNNITTMLLKTLDGIFGVAALSDNVKDNSANVLTKEVMAQSMFLLGDNYSKLTAIAMHSAVFAKLFELDLVTLIQPSAMNPNAYYTYMNKRVIIDDSIVPDTTGTDPVYPIYLFGEGAIAFNENGALAEIETDRDKLEGTDYLITRRVFTLHPRGVKWVGTPVGETPSDAELATASNWALVENPKNVRIAKVLTKI